MELNNNISIKVADELITDRNNDKVVAKPHFL